MGDSRKRAAGSGYRRAPGAALPPRSKTAWGWAARLAAVVPRAIGRAAGARAAAGPSAMSPRIGTSGTTPIGLPMGNRSRQLGQNPDTGVVTYPQFRQRTGRRFRAMAWLAAFSMRDPF